MDDPVVSQAVAASFLSGLSEPTRAKLLETARLVRRRPGDVLIDGHQGFAGVVVSGLLRVYAAGEGDSVTYRNVARGEAVGLAAFLGEDDDLWVDAASVSIVLSLDLPLIAQLRVRDADFNLAIGREALHRLRDTSRELVMRLRGSILQRVARHVLDLAAEIGDGDPVSIRTTHEEIAESIGSRREVVTRALGQLRDARVVKIGRGKIVIRDPLRLRALALGR